MQWKYQIISFFLDLVLIGLPVTLLHSIGMLILEFMANKGEVWLWLSVFLAGNLLLMGFFLSFFLTMRLEMSAAVFIYSCAVVYVVWVDPSLSHSITAWLVGSVNELNILVMATLVAIIKWFLEVIFVSMGVEIEYPVIDWLKQKWEGFSQGV